MSFGLGAGTQSSEGGRNIRYIGEETGFSPQMELAEYMAMLGLQKKTDADSLYGGVGNARKYGYGMFGINPLGAAVKASQPPPNKAEAPEPEMPVTPAKPPKDPPPKDPPPKGPPPKNPTPKDPPPPPPPPYGGPPPAGGPPGNPPTPPRGPGGGVRNPAPENMVDVAPTPEELLAQWTRTNGRPTA